MHKTKSSKTDSSIDSNSLSPNSHSQLAYKPFASQPPKVSGTAKTSTDVEDVAFAEQQMEATGLEIQAKYGLITPVGQERLTVLQAKMDGLLNYRLSHARRFSHNIANIPLLRPDTSTPIQAKLTIGEPGDKYEQEADETARQVVQRIHQPQGEKVQRESSHEDEELQMKPERRIQRESFLEEEELQMKPMVLRVADGGMATSPDLETSIQQARGSGQPMADSIKSPMEQAFGADFSGVKVHTDTQADLLNQSIQAKAFTTGQDVFFRQGAYEPGSRGGQELIAHELTHVVQQKGGKVGMDITGTGRSPERVQRTCGDNNAHKFTNFGNPEYGSLHNDSGTCMDVLLSTSEPVTGSSATSPPSWWPGGLAGKMVQGHLWNADVGGPGDKRDNLTPLTASANSQHHAKVESELKKDYDKGDTINYVVQALYPHKNVTELTIDAGAQGILTPHLANIPEKIHAEYTKYDPSTLTDKGHVSWDIGNEHKGIT